MRELRMCVHMYREKGHQPHAQGALWVPSFSQGFLLSHHKTHLSAQWPEQHGLMWLVVAVSRVRRRLYPKLWDLQILPSGVSRSRFWHGISINQTTLFQKKGKVHICSFCNVCGSTWVQNENIHRLEILFILWVCYIFFFHHPALQIILVLFLWCIKLVHC